MNAKINVLIDWITFTVKDETDPRAVIKQYLGIDSRMFQDLGYGINFYSQCLEFNGIMVLYEPVENVANMSGVSVSMSGTGCRTFEHFSKLRLDGCTDTQGMVNLAFPQLFQLLHINGCNVSRIDIACDDHAGLLDMDDIADAVKPSDKSQLRRFRSRLSKITRNDSAEGDQDTGTTIYIGAPSSDLRFRIYDKAKEQGDLSSHWVRLEMVLRGKNALGFVENFVNCESLGVLASGILNDKIQFIERDDVNISRCSVSGWWLEFVDGLAAIKVFSREVVQHPIEQTQEWFVNTLAPVLGMLTKAYGSVWLHETIKQGQERMREKQKRLVLDYRNTRSMRVADLQVVS